MCEWAVFCTVFFSSETVVGREHSKKKNQKIGRKRLFLRIISVLNKAYIRKPWARFSKVPKSSRTRKAVAKSHIFGLQSCFIHIFLNMNRDSLHTIRFSVIHFSPPLNANYLKMAFRARKISGAFEEQAPGPRTHPPWSSLGLIYNCNDACGWDLGLWAEG